MASINSSSPSRADLTDQYRAQQAEKDQVKEQNEAEIENLKKAYAAQKEDLKDRYETSLQTDRQHTYENLRNTKMQLNREERQMDAVKNELLNQKQSEFTHEAVQTEQEGRAHLTQLRQQYVTAEDYERGKLLSAENEIRTGHKQVAEHILSDSQKKIEALRAEKMNYLEDQKTLHAQALGQIEGHYQDIRTQNLNTYQTDIQNVAHKISEDLNQRKLAGAEVIQKFDSKQGDPFYQIKRFESDLLDIGDAYVLRVKVPEYDRKQFRVQISGQEMQLSGVRSFDETVKLDSDRSISSKSYQNVSERYRLASPVDGRALTQKEDGEWMEYHLPKFGPNHRLVSQYHSPTSFADDKVAETELKFIDTLPTPTIPGNAKGRGPMGA